MKTIVILSGVPYDSVKQRPQHIASYFAQNGYEVFYIYLFDYEKLSQKIILDINSKEQLLNVFSKNRDNVFFLEKKLELDVKTSVLTLLINKIIEVYGAENVIFIAAFPEWIRHLDSLPRSSLLIYDCIDEWEEFLYDVDFGYTEELIYNERKLASLADVVTTSANKLYVKMSYFNDKIYYLPNGVWNDDYKSNNVINSIPLDLQYIKQPIVFFMGAVAEWVDLELIQFVAESRPQYSFVFVGDQRVKLPRSSNIYYLGSKKYEELPNYLQEAKVAIIPFKVNNLTAAVTPLKFYEYLSSGTPVVTTIMPDIMNIEGSRTALDKYDFVNFIDFYINMEDSRYEKEVNKARETVKSFDWGNLLRPIVSIVEGENFNNEKKETFINSLVQNYEKYHQNDLIRNELLNAFCSIGKYEEAIKLFIGTINNDLTDFEKLALSYVKVNNFEKAMYFLKKYLEKNNKRILKVYVHSLLSENNFTSLLEVYLLKLSGNIYEALRLTDQLIEISGHNSKLLGLLTGLYLNIGEYDIAFQIAIDTLKNLNGLKIEEVFDFYTIAFFIRSLAKRSEYDLAEEIALSLIPISIEWKEKMTQLLADIYISKHMDN